jgi:sodium-coupled monocarboxylate transporter 8/12
LQYLELRFGRVARLAASLAFSLQMILYMGIVVYAPALALEAVTGLSKTLSVLSIGLVCTFYSTIGGMKAVVVTDVFQVGQITFENLVFYTVMLKKKP